MGAAAHHGIPVMLGDVAHDRARDEECSRQNDKAKLQREGTLALLEERAEIAECWLNVFETFMLHGVRNDALDSAMELYTALGEISPPLKPGAMCNEDLLRVYHA